MNHLDSVRTRTEVSSPVQDQVDIQIERSAIPPSNMSSPSLDISIENVTCKPKEVLSFASLEVQKRVNSKFGVSASFSDLINALHYLHVTFLELENTSKSIRLDNIDDGIKQIKGMVYTASAVCLTTAMTRASGVPSEFTRVKKAIDKILEFRGVCTDGNLEIVLMSRFEKLKDKNTRIKGMKEALIRPLDELQKTFECIQELFDLTSKDFFVISQDASLKGDINQEFKSYINCMDNILKHGCNPAGYLAEGACPLAMMDAFLKDAQILADLKNMNKGNLVKRCTASVDKNIEMSSIILNSRFDFSEDKLAISFYHLTLMHVISSVEVSVNKLLLTKFHISEIASIELAWILEELQLFDFEKIKTATIKPIDYFKGRSKYLKMLEKMSHLTRLVDKDYEGNLFLLLQRFMDSTKTIELWCGVKSEFNSLKSEIVDIKKSMTECNAELQTIINQTKWESQEEIDHINLAIEEFKSTLSPFLFVAFRLPNTLDDFVVEGKDGLFKKSKVKTLNHDTQIHIKDLLRVNLPKIEVVETIQPVIVVPTKKSEPVKKQPQKVKPEPKVFQTNKVDDILAELKERGWVKDHYHGSHLIFKKEREIFTVPTNHSRVKDGLLSGLNRQIVEKECRINHNGAK